MSKWTVMIADDEPDILRDLQGVLAGKGYDVKLAVDGEAVIESINDISPDLLLIDWMMPQLTGEEVAKRIRKHRNFKEINELPIILMTSLSTQENFEGLPQDASIGRWVKDFTPPGIAKLDALLDGKLNIEC